MALHEKIVLIGAGSAMFTRGLLADLIRSGCTGELALVDIDADAVAVADGLARKMVELAGTKLKITATTDRRQALPDATAVISTIGVGGRRAWEQDVFVPRRHGIYQPVGDSVMPGGSSRALRMIRAMVAIARDVMALCPQAIFINYANPMSVLCSAVRKATGADMIGLCHGVMHSEKELGQLLGVTPGGLQYTAVGINHLTWFTDVRAGGVDLMPKLREIARQKVAIPLNERNFGLLRWGGDEVTCEQEQPFTWRLMDLLGAYPVPGDRHVTEFYGHIFGRQGGYFGKTLGVNAYTFEGIIANGDRGYEQMRQMSLGQAPLPTDFLAAGSGEHEQAVEIIEGIRTGSGRIYSANLPNRGQVSNLPADAVLECPAVARATGLSALALPPLPAGIAGTLATRFQWVETIVEAGREGSRRKFVQALLLDGAVIDFDAAGRLADDLLAAQKQYLPQFRP